MTLDEIYIRLEERKKVLNWVILGLGQHGFQIKDVDHLEWDWICKNYNISNSPYTRNYKTVIRK